MQRQRRQFLSALVVPKIADLPPYPPTAARELTAAAIVMLKQTVR